MTSCVSEQMQGHVPSLQRGEVTKPSTHSLSRYVLPLCSHLTDVWNTRYSQRLSKSFFSSFFLLLVLLGESHCSVFSALRGSARQLNYWCFSHRGRLLLCPQDNNSWGTHTDWEITASNTRRPPSAGAACCVSSKGSGKWASPPAVCTSTCSPAEPGPQFTSKISVWHHSP